MKPAAKRILVIALCGAVALLIAVVPGLFPPRGGQECAAVNVIVSDFDAGIRNYDTKNYVHPSVRVPWILERISHDSGISFEWPSSIKSGLIDRLLVPLTTKTGEREDESKEVTCHMKYRNGQVEGQGDYYVHAAITAQVQAEHVQTAGQSNDIYWGLKMLHDNMVLRISGSFNFLYTSDEPRTPRFLAFT